MTDVSTLAAGKLSLVPAASVNGLVMGSLFALFAISVVILMKTTGVGNFAAGSMAMFMSFAIYRAFGHDLHLPIWIAALVGLGGGAILGLLTYCLVIAPRPGYGPMNLTFRCIGVMLLLTALANLIWASGQPFSVAGVISTRSVRLVDVNVGYDQIGVLLVAIIVLLLFYMLVQRTRLGLWMRAVGSDRASAQLIGVNVRVVEVVAWMLVGAIAAVIGLLFAPITLLSTDMMDTFLVSGFTAAVIGGIFSFTGSAIGGLLLGVLLSVVSLWAGPVWQQLAVLAALLLVLLLRPNGLFASGRARRRV